jgi:rhodanese-related sulfurtransferase
MNKKLFWEIVGIVVVSSLIGIAVNLDKSVVNQVPWVYQPKKMDTISTNVFNNQIDTTKDKLNDTAGLSYKPLTQQQKDSMQHVLDSIKVVRDSILKIKKLMKFDSKQQTVTFEQLAVNLNNKNIVIVDARTPELYAKGHIGKAINIYAYSDQDDPQSYLQKLVDLPKDKVIIIYCDGGHCDLSHKIVEELKSFGYPKVFLYQGGWEEWEKLYLKK